MPPEMNPDLNGPLVAFLASEHAGHVNGQVFGGRGFAYTLFQTPKPLAAMYEEGGMTAAEVAKNFDAAFAEHLSVPGIPRPSATKLATTVARSRRWIADENLCAQRVGLGAATRALLEGEGHCSGPTRFSPLQATRRNQREPE